MDSGQHSKQGYGFGTTMGRLYGLDKELLIAVAILLHKLELYQSLVVGLLIVANGQTMMIRTFKAQITQVTSLLKLKLQMMYKAIVDMVIGDQTLMT